MRRRITRCWVPSRLHKSLRLFLKSGSRSAGWDNFSKFFDRNCTVKVFVKNSGCVVCSYTTIRGKKRNGLFTEVLSVFSLVLYVLEVTSLRKYSYRYFSGLWKKKKLQGRFFVLCTFLGLFNYKQDVIYWNNS